MVELWSAWPDDLSLRSGESGDVGSRVRWGEVAEPGDLLMLRRESGQGCGSELAEVAEF